jgi:hypothetical protein
MARVAQDDLLDMSESAAVFSGIRQNVTEKGNEEGVP